MIFIYHTKAKRQVKVISEGELLQGFPLDLVDCFWQLCERFPEEIILWIDADLDIEIGNKAREIFEHPLIMVSYPVKNFFIPDAIGYVDQLPFVNPKLDVQYPTWRMSTDIGGVFGRTAIHFMPTLSRIKDFGFLINSIAKIGQQNSLFCYSSPQLVNIIGPKKKKSGNVSELFRFTAQHYKKARLLILFFCFIKYEKKFPIWTFLKNLPKKSYFQKRVDLPVIEEIPWSNENKENIDVIIPTLGRPKHLKDVLIDLQNQQKKPAQVIIVEQNPVKDSETELDFLFSEEWSFEIIHHLIDQVGACNARNLALQYVKAEWIFFADDDIRLGNDLLYKALKEINRLSISALNLNCIQEGESTAFRKVKQWGAFGSGTSIVKSGYALKCRFSYAFEHGFGEDIDFGMQLRNLGCDIIYHPAIVIKHLKAERGGFREVLSRNQDMGKPQPKPSPTMMLLVRKHYNIEMLNGYKVDLFIKYFQRQPVKNPFVYYRIMQKRWQLSEKLSRQIQKAIENS